MLPVPGRAPPASGMEDEPEPDWLPGMEPLPLEPLWPPPGMPGVLPPGMPEPERLPDVPDPELLPGEPPLGMLDPLLLPDCPPDELGLPLDGEPPDGMPPDGMLLGELLGELGGGELLLLQPARTSSTAPAQRCPTGPFQARVLRMFCRFRVFRMFRLFRIFRVICMADILAAKFSTLEAARPAGCIAVTGAVYRGLAERPLYGPGTLSRPTPWRLWPARRPRAPGNR